MKEFGVILKKNHNFTHSHPWKKYAKYAKFVINALKQGY